ncbi:MAG TPA: helix-turn-helix domain-containing protein [Paracoccaceae bacterium]
MEFELLRVFAHNPNRVLSRDRLLDLAHHRDNEPFDRSIDVRVTRLRKKIEPDPAAPQTIKTIRGVGYMFTPTRRG